VSFVCISLDSGNLLSMTPAVTIIRKKGIRHFLHEYAHDAKTDAYGIEAAEKLGIEPARVFKTLVVQLDSQELVVGVVPVSATLNMKRIARSAGTKKAAMATQADVIRSTGYVLGGVSPLGQRKRLRTIIDVSARSFDTIFVSAGRRGLEIELSPDDLAMLVNGRYADIRQ
jgi:Cys-tRNA(Pro)/Cys-tRNA(Cys) deacylase